MVLASNAPKNTARPELYVVVVANEAATVEEAVSLLGDMVTGIVCDVSRPLEVEQAIRQTLDLYGKIDAIHNNAGIADPSKPLHETEEDQWERLFDINLKSILFTTRYGLEALKQSGGCILNTSSLVGEIGQENHAAYSATKGAINALTKSMAVDYARYKIRVNAVAPAAVWTPLLREWVYAQDSVTLIGEYLDGIHLLGYCPDGDVVADACAFLISDQARFITGCILPVSGGADLGYRRVMTARAVTGKDQSAV